MNLFLLLHCLLPALVNALSFSTGFSDDAVLQRSNTSGSAIYGFAHTAGPIEVSLSGKSGDGNSVSYKVSAVISQWVNNTGCSATACFDKRTPVPPVHGKFIWRAVLRPQTVGGGDFTSAVASSNKLEPNATLTLARLTYGDVYFCSGQSNMALQTYYTFSSDTLRAEIAAGKYAGLRHFMYGSMSDRFISLAPQWVTSWNSLSAGSTVRVQI